jgi:hypothetical protein
MRTPLINYLKSQSAVLKTVSVADELPWTKDGEPLYQKNFKKIYIDKENTTQETLFNTLQGASIVNEITAVTAYLTVDAKTPLSNYDEIVNLIKTARNQVEPQAKLDRIINVTTTLEGDAQLAEFTFEFRKVKFN